VRWEFSALKAPLVPRVLRVLLVLLVRKHSFFVPSLSLSLSRSLIGKAFAQ